MPQLKLVCPDSEDGVPTRQAQMAFSNEQGQEVKFLHLTLNAVLPTSLVLSAKAETHTKKNNSLLKSFPLAKVDSKLVSML